MWNRDPIEGCRVCSSFMRSVRCMWSLRSIGGDGHTSLRGSAPRWEERLPSWVCWTGGYLSGRVIGVAVEVLWGNNIMCWF